MDRLIEEDENLCWECGRREADRGKNLCCVCEAELRAIYDDTDLMNRQEMGDR